MSTTTVAAGTLDNYEGDEVTLKLRRYVHKKFITSDGNIIMPGRVGTPYFYDVELTCTVSNGVVSYPQFTLDSTSDAISNPKNTYYDLALFTTDGRKVKTVAQKIRVPASPTSTTLPALIVYSGQGVSIVADEAYTKEEIDVMLANLVSSAQKASTSQFGVAKSSDAHDDPLTPIHVSTTSPKLALTDSPLVIAYKPFSFACYGDSITAGYGATTPWPTLLSNELSSVVAIRAVNGTQAAAAATKLSNETMFQDHFVIIWVGHNDIGGGTVSSVKASIATMVATLGHTNYLILGTLNQRSMTSGTAGHTFVTSLNTDLEALYPDNFFDMREYLVSLGSGGDVTSDIIAAIYLQGDGQHPSDLGMTTIAARLATYFTARTQQQKTLTLSEEGFLYAGNRPFLGAPAINTNFTVYLGSYPADPTVIPTRSVVIAPHFEPSASPQGDYCVVIGSGAGVGLTNAYDTYIGAFSGNTANGGNSSTCVGYYSGAANAGYQQAFFGANAGKVVTSGSYNTFIGCGAGSAMLTGSNCVFLGTDAGNLSTAGDNNILIGKNIQCSTTTASNELNIGGVIGGNLSTKKFGYVAGTGGSAAAQATDKSTTVTINKSNGEVTTHNANLNDNTSVSFQVTNSTVEANDEVSVWYKSGASGVGGEKYLVWAHTPAAGSFRISIRNISGGNLGEALVIGFTVRKAVIA